jgi:inorganic pyrophosphatase
MNHHIAITQWRVVKTGAQNFVRNLTLAIAAIAVMVITLTIILFSVMSNATFTHTVQQITDKIDVSVYLKDSVKPAEKDKLISDIKALSNTKSVEYVSKNDALKVYIEQNKNNPDLLAAISQTDNPLPATVVIKPVDPNKIDELKSFLEKAEIKKLQSEETSYSGDRKEAIDKISKATKFFREAGIASVVIFALVSMHSSQDYPFDYGFVPQTHWDDGDALDVVVLTTYPLFPGLLLEARPVAIMHMIDGGDADEKVIAVPVGDPRFADIKDLSDINPHTLKEIKHFFMTYKQIQNKEVTVGEFEGKDAAMQAFTRATELYTEKK